MTDTSSGTIETKQEETKQGTDPIAVYKLWMQSIELAGKEEESWRKAAKNAVETYEMEGDEKARQKFNILYSNTETICPAIYNTPPIADVRRRYNDDDPDGKAVAQTIERCLSFSIDTSCFDEAIKADVLDAVLPGRGVSRVQYRPYTSDGPMGPQIVYQQLYLQHVEWDDFRRGPATDWDNVPWVAFRHRMTREQLVQLSPEAGMLVKLDSMIEGYNPDKSDAPSDIFKRAIVWEIWDKESGQILFIAESYKAGPLAMQPPPFNLEKFFPVPKPLYAVMRSGKLVPIEPYRMYKAQAEELDSITKRLAKLIKVLRWRGIRAKALGDAFDKIKDLDDGELAPAENAFEVLQKQGNMEAGVWLMPIDKLIVVVKELVEQRERVKQTIYEITGIADIMRGASNANETLGAQQIKTQWGTLRVQDLQKGVQRYVRDIFRIMAEIVSQKFEPQVLAMMTGITLLPEQVQLMQNDVLRQYRIDVESDSTIRADVSQAQQNISQFIQGLGQFATAVGPMVLQGAMPPEVAITMIASFSRVFKLGRQVEDAIDKWQQQAMAAMQQQTMMQTQAMGLAPPGMPGQMPGAAPRPTVAQAGTA